MNILNPALLFSFSRRSRRLLAALSLLGVMLISDLVAQEILIPNGAQWRWRKGTNEVSNPTTLWRATGYNDSTWPVGNAPFHYGNSGATGDDGLTNGTILADMRNSYRSVFLRRSFNITNVNEVAAVQLNASYDDGFVAWINGVEVARANFNGSPTYLSNALSSLEPAATNSFVVSGAPQNYLATGSNVLTVQAFNNTLSGSDFRFDGQLQITKLNFNPPVITNVVPAPGGTLAALVEVSVFFNRPMSGVDAADLFVNDQPATSVSGAAGTNRFTFNFTQPAAGLVRVGWSESHGITDLQGTAFDPAAPNASWNYTLTDTTAPVVAERAPVADATVSQLTQIELWFSEPVFGVDAGDLRVNGQPAVSVTGAEAGPYVFQFAAPGAGVVNFSWAGGNGIGDGAGNAFAGGSWSVTLNSTLAPGDVIINEFVAGNLTGLTDEDGERPDWIEIYNRGTTPVNLIGWSLTDNADLPGQWTFPSQILNPGEYLVVFASGKDRRAPVGANKFHTNFKLDLFGNYLALFNAEYPRGAVTEFPADYPEQRNNYAYGLDNGGQWRYFAPPTPGGPNGNSAIVGIAPEPHFSVTRGLFHQPFHLLLTTTVPGAAIRYTRDGSEPTLANGFTYIAPLLITNTTFVRAVVFAPNQLPSRTRTHSYIYLDSVLTQPDNPAGFPSTWGTYADFPGGIVPADYGVDLDPLRVDANDPGSAIDPEKLQRFQEGLRELPVVSITMNVNDMFTSSGLYHTPHVTNKDFPAKPCSVEMILPDGTTAFAVNAGLSGHGNASREPRKNPKHGFKLSFKGEFGESTLDYPLFPDSPAVKFDDLILRADFGSSWRHQSDTSGEGLGAFQRSRATRTRDAWFKDTFRDMGQVASHNRYCHLFINGLYWGTYDFTEQANASFAPNYYGGEKEDFDVYEQGELKNGTSTAYNTMTSISGLVTNANYELMKQYLDVPQHIDSLVMHLFVGHQDWGGTKNWYAIRKRVSGPLGTFKYIPWDGENLLLNENIDRANSPGGYGWPSGLHGKLAENAQYRLDFADRVHKHMVAPDGALTPNKNIARWAKWMAIMDKPIVAESVRWGDYRRDVHPWQTGTYQLYTREEHWLAESNRIVNSYLPNRNATVLSQFRRDGLYPNLDAPEFRQNTVAGSIIGGGAVGAGYVVAMRNPGAGTIYFTTNGVDPRVYYSGVIDPAAQTYSVPLTLNATVTVKARVFNGVTWSALNEATFTVGELGVPLRFTEIMYNPSGGDAYEFIEVRNVGGVPLNLGGFSFQGITFVVPSGTILPPGGILLLANNANPALFAARYPSVTVSGYYGGNLSNGGERIAILDTNGNTVVAVHYDDEAGWPTSPDGGGYSLEIIDSRGDLNAPANWRASSAVNGTPGLPPVAPASSDVVLNEIAADNAGSVANDSTFPDWVELHNRSGAPVNIGNWSLTDNGVARQFVFPANTIISAGGYLVVWCDSATNSPGLHTGFALGKGGETVSLFDANTNRVDALTFGLQLTDYTVGRVGADWVLTSPTPGATNSATAQAAPAQLAINEWLADAPVGSVDWIEIFNRSATLPVALRGLSFGTSNQLFQYQALSFVAPQSHVQLFADELPGANHLEFKLPATGGAIVLYNEAALELERVTYGPQTEAVSAGRLPDGGATLVSFPGSASPGASNYQLTWTGPVLNEVLARNDRAAVSPWGSYADFVELYNPGGSPVALGGLALGRSTAANDRWMFPAGATIPANGHLVIWCDGSRAASTSAGEPYNAGFNLPGGSGAVLLFNVAGQPVDRVEYGFQVADLSVGRIAGAWQLLAAATPGAANSAAAALGSVAALRLNEWMAAPLVGADWFELYNPNPLPVAMGGLFVTDNPSTTGIVKSPIAPLSFIGGRKWVQFFANGSPNTGADHVAFAFARDGETLRLYDADTNLIDAIDFGVQTDGVSQGRLPDGAGNIVTFPITASPASANFLPLTSVVINEVLTHTDPPLEDAIELHNPTASPVNIGGWFLSDSQSDLKRYRIPDGTTIPAGGFKVFYQNQFGAGVGDDDAPPFFSFNSARGDAAYLSVADAGQNLTGYRTSVSFDAQANGVSFGRHHTSVGVEFVALSQRTFGVDNPANLAQFRTGGGTTNAYPLVGPVVINEIMYHPPNHGTNSPDAEEFIELLNLSATPVALFDPAHPANVWRLANAVSFDFPLNTSIPAQGTLVVVPFDPLANSGALAAFRSRYGTNGTLLGPYSGTLNNAGETIELWRPDAPQTAPPDAGFVPQILVERVSYSNVAPWPLGAGGGGVSLQRIVAANYGNEPVNWRAGLPTVGMPNVFPPTGTASLPGGGVVRLSFTVQPGLTYRVEYKNNLTDATWLLLGGTHLATGETLLVDDNLNNQPQRFYRLSVVW
jgi:hypothetical protein